MIMVIMPFLNRLVLAKLLIAMQCMLTSILFEYNYYYVAVIGTYIFAKFNYFQQCPSEAKSVESLTVVTSCHHRHTVVIRTLCTFCVRDEACKIQALWTYGCCETVTYM